MVSLVGQLGMAHSLGVFAVVGFALGLSIVGVQFLGSFAAACASSIDTQWFFMEQTLSARCTLPAWTQVGSEPPFATRTVAFDAEQALALSFVGMLAGAGLGMLFANPGDTGRQAEIPVDLTGEVRGKERPPTRP